MKNSLKNLLKKVLSYRELELPAYALLFVKPLQMPRLKQVFACRSYLTTASWKYKYQQSWHLDQAYENNDLNEVIINFKSNSERIESRCEQQHRADESPYMISHEIFHLFSRQVCHSVILAGLGSIPIFEFKFQFQSPLKVQFQFNSSPY